MYAVYKKQRKAKNIEFASPKLFVAEMSQHFLKTHPEGKAIARVSDIDEEVQDLVVHLKNDEQVAGMG